MLDLIKSRPTGLRELIERHGATTSPEIAGALLSVLNHARREGPSPAEVNSAIFGLLRTLRVWEISPRTPEGMLSIIRQAIEDNGIPDDADRYALAELIVRAASLDQKTCSRLELINDTTIVLCASLAAQNELLPILALQPGSRERVAHQFQEMRDRYGADETR